MNLIGDINLSAPDYEEKQITFESDGNEFYLITRKGSKPMIDDFDITLQIDKDKEVVISTDIESPEKEGIFRDSLFIGIESKEGGSVGLSFSIGQICALVEILERYLKCYYAIRALATERVIKSG